MSVSDAARIGFGRLLGRPQPGSEPAARLALMLLVPAASLVSAQQVLLRDAQHKAEFEARYPPYKRDVGPFEVQPETANWVDVDRNRTIPVRLYIPKAQADMRLPLVVFSHGLGGSRDGYAYLGQHWASHGYVVIHLQHPGSDESVWADRRYGRMAALVDAARDADNWRLRPQDVSFVISRALRDPQLEKRIDPARIGVAGHSFGAYTALAMAGMTVDLPRMEARGAEGHAIFADPRVRTVIALSPPAAGTLGLDRRSWTGINRPAMYVTGTKDATLDGRSPRQRLQPYERCNGPDQALVVIRDADHMTFAGVDVSAPGENAGRARRKPTDATHLDYVRMATTAFLDSYLKEDAFARQWLGDRILQRLSGGAVEQKMKNVSPLAQPAPAPVDRR